MTTRHAAAAGELTLVLDIGKSHAKLLMIDAAGAVVEQHGRANRSVTSSLGYPALDIAGLTQWVTTTLAASPATRRCTHAIASTHGAAIVALGDDGLAWEPVDYEYDGIDPTRDAYQAERDDFTATLAPDLPAGLNAARPLFWMQHTHVEAWARTRVLLPYPQYWAWWLSGVASSEVSSLGCHTQLWRPAEQRFSGLATRHGWASRFAPLRPAQAVLGHVSAQRAHETGLPATCAVHVGVHDSNACLARYLRVGRAMTLVSSGTWIVVMAPGASACDLDPARDMLANVSVRGEVVPTARFMGGRELQALCAGASPALANLDDLAGLLRRDVQALPSFAGSGGPFAGRQGVVTERGSAIDGATALTAPERASLAALYCAQVSAHLLDLLGAPLPAVLEGPFADNLVYRHALATLLPPSSLHVNTDAVDGTARGAWRLVHWDRPFDALGLKPVDDGCPRQALQQHHRRWLGLLEAGAH
jgi:sugar (pentulose or hexulose) kinase